MKRLLWAAGLIFLLGACEKVENPVKTAGKVCGDCEDSLTVSYITTQNVLIEEFTGITCNNCPTATAEAERLQNQNLGRVFVLGIHASNFAIPDPANGYEADFRTDEGAEIFEFAQPVGVPTAMINRIDYGESDFTKFHQSWEAAIDPMLQRSQAAVGMFGEAELNHDSSRVCVEVYIKSLADLSDRNLYWAAFLHESNIVAAQKQPDNSKDTAYVHNHVLRKGFNGYAGEPLTGIDFTAAQDETICTSRGISLDEEWKVENLGVIVYVYDYESKEILQVVEAHL